MYLLITLFCIDKKSIQYQFVAMMIPTQRLGVQRSLRLTITLVSPTELVASHGQGVTSESRAAGVVSRVTVQVTDSQ